MNSAYVTDATQAGDAVSILRWGLRRYLWVVILAVVAVGILVPLQEFGKKPVYTSEALVVAADTTTDLKTLPRYGADVFDNGVVARRIQEQFGTGGDVEDIVPKRASVITAQDNIVMHVQGHSSDPQEAADIANLAAQVFTDELNKGGSGVGTFAVQSTAMPSFRAG